MTDWSQVVREHGPIVWRTAYRILDNEADAADCFQNTFVSAFSLSLKDTITNWPGLLKRLATARALDCLRRRYRESRRFGTLAEVNGAVQAGVEPSHEAEAAELAELLREALADLDARQAEVFCLYSLEGFDYRQIADRLDVTVNHVGVLLSRARRQLRESLRTYAPSPVSNRDIRETRE
ncbi:MAG: sigma-70 family RNA polymerase sigma factor [Planctomycetes bacterium]|nr:sigma-70 family RNA polymerase sigma factor [Planctomycetota bacterium]